MKGSYNGWLLPIFVIGTALVGLAAIWNLSVSVTDLGNPVLGCNYITVLIPPLKTYCPYSTGSMQTQQPLPHEPKEDRIDAEFFNLLTPGVTTYGLLQGYLRQDELESSSSLGGVDTRSYLVRNTDRSTVYLVFQNDILVSKSQHGL